VAGSVVTSPFWIEWQEGRDRRRLAKRRLHGKERGRMTFFLGIKTLPLQVGWRMLGKSILAKLSQ
jgi:hypothetical protein